MVYMRLRMDMTGDLEPFNWLGFEELVSDDWSVRCSSINIQKNTKVTWGSRCLHYFIVKLFLMS